MAGTESLTRHSCTCRADRDLLAVEGAGAYAEWVRVNMGIGVRSGMERQCMHGVTRPR